MKKVLQGEGSNLHGAVSCSTKFSGRPWSFRYCYQNGSMLYLSCFPHPRDKRACLPKSLQTIHSKSGRLPKRLPVFQLLLQIYNVTRYMPETHLWPQESPNYQGGHYFIWKQMRFLGAILNSQRDWKTISDSRAPGVANRGIFLEQHHKNSQNYNACHYTENKFSCI